MGVYFDKYKKYYDSILKVENNFKTFEKIIHNTNTYSGNYISLSNDLISLKWSGDSKKKFQEKVIETSRSLIEFNSDISSNGKIIIDKSLELKLKIEQINIKEQEQDSVKNQINTLNNLKSGIERRSVNFAYAFWTNKDEDRLSLNKNRLASLNKEIETLVAEAEKIISILQGITYNVLYVEEGSKLETNKVEIIPTPEPTIAPTSIPTPEPTVEPTAVPTPEPTPSQTPEVQQEMVKVNDILNKLGVKRDSNGNPLKINGYYILRTQKYPDLKGFYCEYMLYLPENKNGEIPKDLQIIFDVHGNGGSRTYKRDGKERSLTIEGLANANPPEMGVKALQENPNINAIIFRPQALNGGNTGVGTELFGRTYEEVLKATGAKSKAILLQFSAGGSTGNKFAGNYPEYVKAMISVDPSPNVEVINKIPKDIPITYFTSTQSKRFPYNGQINNAYGGGGIDRTIYDSTPLQGKYTEVDSIIVPNNGLTPVQEAVFNHLKSANQPGDRKLNIPGTTHESLRDLVFNGYNYNVILDVFK